MCTEVESRAETNATEPKRYASLEGIGWVKDIEACHSKADAFMIPEMYFLIDGRPFSKTDVRYVITVATLLDHCGL